jgi:hypothetical protein
MRKRLLAILVALIVGLGFVGVAAAPAQAYASSCTADRFCVWDNFWYNGSPTYYWTISHGTGGVCLPFNGSLNDNVDSAVIAGGRSATLYSDGGCTGLPVFFLQPNAYGGPYAGACGDYASDNWACSWSLPGSLPSSVWVIRLP